MKQNRSLAISNKIQEITSQSGICLLDEVFPTQMLKEMEPPDTRERVYDPVKTLYTMTLTAAMADKSLQNAVVMHYALHKQRHRLELDQSLRSRKNKSLEKDISLNTAGYSKARTRLPLAMAKELFNASRAPDVHNEYSHWHGFRVFIADGTYLQLQDTVELREKYKVVTKAEENSGYPQGLLEGITERGSGQVYSFRLSNRHVSELALFYDMIDEIPSGSIMLMDDLYNSYEIISQLIAHEIMMVVPAKRNRNYIVIEQLAAGDEIIELKKPIIRAKWIPATANPLPETIRIRRIECLGMDGKPYVIYTTVLDRSITKDEIQVLYFSRWDIEISIREVKTIMDINILRSKTEEMILKELLVSLAAYNLIRQIILASIQDLPFSPEEDFIYKFYTLNKDVHIDKRGRVYNRWSTGRRRTVAIDTK